MTVVSPTLAYNCLYATLWNAEVAVWPFTIINSSWGAYVSVQKIIEITNHWKSVTYFTLIVFILRSYINELKWHINSEWAILGRMLLSVLLASCINVQVWHLCWKRTFWAHAVIKMMRC